MCRTRPKLKKGNRRIRCERVIQSLQVRQFGAARAAPGGPEVDEQFLPAEAVQGELRSIETAKSPFVINPTDGRNALRQLGRDSLVVSLAPRQREETEARDGKDVE